MKQPHSPRWRRWRDAGPLLPALATVLAILATVAGAAYRGMVFEPSVVGAFVVIGAIATLVTRQTPWHGALFIMGFAAIVITVLYLL